MSDDCFLLTIIKLKEIEGRLTIIKLKEIVVHSLLLGDFFSIN